MSTHHQNAGAVTAKRRADEHAAAVAPVIEEIRAQGIMTAHGIAVELNQRRVRTLKGGLWAAVQVKRLLERLNRSKGPGAM